MSDGNPFDPQDPANKPEQSEQDIADAADVDEYLHEVIDPEIGINVVDLGLVYDIWIEHREENTKRAVVNMTLTSPACPLTDMIEDQVASVVTSTGTADEVQLNWVWMPPWNPQMISEEGQEQMRALGFGI